MREYPEGLHARVTSLDLTVLTRLVDARHCRGDHRERNRSFPDRRGCRRRCVRPNCAGLASLHRVVSIVLIRSPRRRGRTAWHAAQYVELILKGEQPADPPLQAPDKHDLAINFKTPKALGLDLPAMRLGRADEVIE
jgi:hypothetical protein